MSQRPFQLLSNSLRDISEISASLLENCCTVGTPICMYLSEQRISLSMLLAWRHSISKPDQLMRRTLLKRQILRGIAPSKSIFQNILLLFLFFNKYFNFRTELHLFSSVVIALN
ncbi:hypothetical protein CDAR_399271 [Caerostris darwini]|uniref:Uncharacterized protein n=1 Tax=Caerostris darwini TaxID=1538125 RepID=A0AAV4SUQ4_9ARAC|nr:hypothetical protein CDAR_399271 [Caerostris darwini]